MLGNKEREGKEKKRNRQDTESEKRATFLDLCPKMVGARDPDPIKTRTRGATFTQLGS